MKFHGVHEQKEYDFRINFFKKKNKKQKLEQPECKTPSKTPLENTSSNGSNTIDSVIRINCNFLQEEGLLFK